MKKIIIFTGLIILIPAVITLICINLPTRELKFKLKNNNFISVRVKRLKTDKIEVIPLEEYVTGVVSGEMPVSFNIEAMKAQAVAARSYVLTRCGYNKDKDYDVVDSTNDQVYLDIDYLKKAWGTNYAININKVRTAVYDTESEVLNYNNKLADAFYFSTSNGFTENASDIFGIELPYLVSVKSNWDKDTSPVFNESKKINLDVFYDLMDIPYDNNLKVEVIEQTKTGRILKLKLNNRLYNATDVVRKLSLRSSAFEITQTENEIKITTHGYGHGVGMSQYGALGMADNGYKYNEILQYYYQGTTIEKIKKNSI